jgi:plasmid stabilization system protein ParE
MTRPVRWSRRAEAALNSLVAWKSETDPGAVEALSNTIIDRADQLGQFPQLGPPSRGATRKLVVIGTDYIIVYREMSDHIRIAGLCHHALRKRR